MTQVKVKMGYIRELILKDLKRKWRKQHIKGEFNPDDFSFYISIPRRLLELAGEEDK